MVNAMAHLSCFQSYLKSMAVDCSLLDSLIKETALLLSNSIFDRELIEKAKVFILYDFIQYRIYSRALSTLVRELLPISSMRLPRLELKLLVVCLHGVVSHRSALQVKNPRSVSLDAIKVCIKNLDLALNSVPEMVTQSTNEYIHDEMKKLQINEQQFMNNNALTMNFENPAIKDVPDNEEH